MTRLERIGLAMFIIVAGAYFAVLLRRNSYIAAGPDSSGYCNEAKLIASGHVVRPVKLMQRLALPPEFIYAFTPLGFAKAQKPYAMVPTYPAGQPLHQVLFAMIGGRSRAPFLVGPVMALLSVLGMVALARAFGLQRFYALGSAAMLAATPLFIVHALQSASDDVATFYSIAAMALALRARTAVPAAVAAGLTFGIGVWVRPTNLLLILPMALAMRWQWRQLLGVVAGAAPAGLALAWWQNLLYGSPFRTGYGTFSSLMQWSPRCGPVHLSALSLVLTPVIVGGAVFFFLARDVHRWQRAELATWFAVFFLFYSFYIWCDGWHASRFLLPAVPALILAFLFVLRSSVSLIEARSGAPFARTVAVLVVVSIVGVMIQRQHELGAYRAHIVDEVYPESVRFAEARLPGNAIVASGLMSGAFLYYADRETVRFDQAVLAGRLPVLRAAAKKAGLQWYALESNVETTPEQFDAWLPARWIPIAVNRDVTLWRLQE